MNRQHILFFILFFFSFQFFSSFVVKTPGSPVASTGAPDEMTCGKAGCHDDAPILNGTGTNQFIILNQDIPKYEPGQWFNFRIAINRPGHDKFGFQAVALRDDLNENVGEWHIYQPNRTQILYNENVIDRYYVTHRQPGTAQVAEGRGAWQMEWKSPETNIGDISFYYATVASNHDGSRFGDSIFISKYTISPFGSTNSQTVEELDALIFPNPVMETITVNLKGEKGINYWRITDIVGKVFMEMKYEDPVNKLEINVNSLPKGTYLLFINSNSIHGSHRFLKL